MWRASPKSMNRSDEWFKAQFLGFHPKLFRIAFALLGNRDDAEDMVQELYYKLWCKREELTAIEHPEAYAITLLKHLCLDALRSPRIVRRAEMPTYEEEAEEGCDTIPLEQQEQIACVTKLIEQLPSNQQQALRLHSIEACSMEEIEQLMGITNTNLRTLLSRARKTVKEQFNKYYNK